MIPVTGLSLHKPSPLWPPPPNDVSCRVRSSLRKSIADVLRLSKDASQAPQVSRPLDPENMVPKSLPTANGPMNVGSTASLPHPGGPDASQSIVLRTAEGEDIEVAEQVHLYAPNSLLKHPLVSPALSYLGGLPPLFFIAGDKEVLRDEIIYACVIFYPHFELVDGSVGPIGLHTRSDFRYVTRQRACTRLSSTSKNTCDPRRCTFKFTMVNPHSESVRRRVPNHFPYSDIAHVLPVLFPFTTPGKYCYRAVALFCKHVTDAQPAPLSPAELDFTASPTPLTPQNEIPTLQVPSPRMHKSLSLRVQRAASSVKRRSSLWSRPSAQENGEPTINSGNNSHCTSGQVTPRSQDPSDTSVDVAGPRVGGGSEPHAEDVPRAGEAWVYASDWVKPIRCTGETIFFS